MRDTQTGRQAQPMTTTPANPALREIGGRIKKLTFRDVQTLKTLLMESLSNEGIHISDDDALIEGILATADKLETA
ncbi:hypothetical protein [Roseococcus sp.]|uniref:hypothetical protein n=1 Tax=Roseococcus sp. TaxID=2109646 RepID=UPI003BADA351